MLLNSNAETLAKYQLYLQLGGMNNWLYVVMTINICSPKFWGDGAVHTHLAMSLATVTDAYVVLILLLQNP